MPVNYKIDGVDVNIHNDNLDKIDDGMKIDFEKRTVTIPFDLIRDCQLLLGLDGEKEFGNIVFAEYNEAKRRIDEKRT